MISRSTRVLAALALAALAALPAAAQADTLDLVGQSDLGGGGLNGRVATVGNTAAVASGILSGGGLRSGFYNGTYTCPATTVKLVDVSTPSAPSIKGQIPVPAGVVANDVSTLRVTTPSFTGDLLAVALVVCNFEGNFIDRGVRYYDITNPANPVFLGRYDADENRELPTDPPCGPDPDPTDGDFSTGRRCASSQDQVTLAQRPDGKVISLSTEPFGSASQGATPSPTAFRGDLRVVDVTNPATPTEVGSYPNRFPAPDERPPGFGSQSVGFSNNGCRAFDGGLGVGAFPDGSKALLPFFDQGLLTVNLADLADPAFLGQYQYPRADRAFEGNATSADLTTSEGRSLALMAESDWIAPNSSLRIDGSSPVAGSKFACEAIFTLFDPENTAQVYRKPGGEVPGGIVYVGTACPASATAAADPYPNGVTAADIAGKIAFRDRGRVASRQGSANFCSVAAAVKRLQDDGAVGVVIGGTSTAIPQTPSFDGDPTGLTIPAFGIDTGDATALRDALCPAPATAPPAGTGPTCAPGGQTLTGAMVDSPGSWGDLRVVDVTDPAAPALRGVYEPPPAKAFPPPDLGVYSVEHAVGRGSTAYVAGNANGLRAIDLTSADPTEKASFVPPDRPDPTGQIPAEAMVRGVDVAENGSIVVSDTNSGLYVLKLTPTPTGGGGTGGGGTGGGGTGGGGTGGGGTSQIPIFGQAKDTTAPLVSLRGKVVQSIKQGFVSVSLRTNEDARLRATGKVARPSLSSKKSRAAACICFKLRPAKASAKAGKTVTLKLRMTKKTIRAVKLGLKRGRRSTAKVRIAVTDAAGNKRTVKRQIRIKK